jgi:bla regulator protein blaR1
MVMSALMAVCAPVALGQAPAPADSASFEVAVIKPSGHDSGNGLSVKFLPGGGFAARNASVRLLIKIAYVLNDDEVSGGPSWIDLKKFDIDAKPDAAAASRTDKAHTRLMLQSLLRDRFKLNLRREMKEMPTFALVVAKGGPKLKKSMASDGDVHFQGGLGRITASNATLDQLAAAVEDWVMHPVENMTGLDGRYDFKLEWTPDQATAPSPANGAGNQPPTLDDSGPTIFTAVQQQLGLSLQSRKIQAPCEVVESVELPSEN